MARSDGLSSVKDSGALKVVLEGEQERVVLRQLLQGAHRHDREILVVGQLGQELMHAPVP
jgi:hypothetical protein